MNPEISKSARDLLAKQPTPEAHPSPDLLNGYAEQSLSPAENAQVLTHLSSCTECREVVFLASGAAEEQMQSRLLAATPKADPALLALPAPMTAAHAKPKPSRNWWRWAAPLAALVIVGSAALIEHDRLAERMSPPSGQMAKTAELRATTPSTPEAKPATTPAGPQKQANEYALDRDAKQLVLPPLAEREMVKKNDAAGQRLAAAQPKRSEAEQARADTGKDVLSRKTLEGQIAANLASPTSNAILAAEGKPKASAPPPSPSTTVEVTSAAPLVQADNADLSTASADALKAESLAKSSLVANNQAAAGSAAAMPLARQKAAATSHWRIGNQGQLERSTGEGTWTQKVASEEVTFRAVATVGNNVWAGGNGGALFHSGDGGDHFNKVVLTANGQTERGAVVSIHFDTAQQGSVSSDSGATWITRDGGQSWRRQ